MLGILRYVGLGTVKLSSWSISALVRSPAAAFPFSDSRLFLFQSLREDVRRQTDREHQLQSRYSHLLYERDALYGHVPHQWKDLLFSPVHQMENSQHLLNIRSTRDLRDVVLSLMLVISRVIFFWLCVTASWPWRMSSRVSIRTFANTCIRL